MPRAVSPKSAQMTESEAKGSARAFSYKNLSEFSIELRKNLKDKSSETLESLAQQFFGAESVEVPQRALSRAKDAVKAAKKTNELERLALDFLVGSFWNAPEPCYQAALNFAAFFDPSSLFENRTREFLALIQAHKELVRHAGKLVEMYIDRCETIEISTEQRSRVAEQMGAKESNLSVLGTIILECLSCEDNFDLCFCYVRSLAEIWLKVSPEIRSIDECLFPENPVLDKCVRLLLTAVIQRKCQCYQDSLFQELVGLLGSESTDIERAYGYTAIGQIVAIVPSSGFFDPFVKQFMQFLMRDFDSTSIPNVNVLKTTYRAIVLRAKKDNVITELGELLWQMCQKLSLKSKVKVWLLPEVMEFIPTRCNVMIPFLIDTAQDCSDGGLVSRCVKTLIKLSENVEPILREVIKAASSVKPYDTLPTFRPLLEPLFQPTKDYSSVVLPIVLAAPLERFSRNWLLFECLRLLIPQKWRVDIDLEAELQYSLRHGNIDLRIAAFTVLSKTKFKLMIPDSFLFCDIPRYQASVEAVFPEWMSNIKGEAGYEQWAESLVKLFSDHMAPIYPLQHIEFASRLRSHLVPNDCTCESKPAPVPFDEEKIRQLTSEILTDNKDAISQMYVALTSSQNPCQSEELLLELADKLFSYFMETKNVLMLANCEPLLCQLAKTIHSKDLVTIWLDKLVTRLKTFDMENLRRSASLPYIALSLCHLAPLAVDQILTTLLHIVDASTIEVEVTHCLNVLRAIFSDKSASDKEEILYTKAIPYVASSLLKFKGWDYVSALNLCLATLLHKVGKRSGDSITIDQFFDKAMSMPQVLVELLKSCKDHAIYITLTVLSVFNRSLKAQTSLQDAMFPLLGHKCLRIRRELVRALLNITPVESVEPLVSKAWDVFKDNQSWNVTHGCLMLTRLVLEQQECDVRRLMPAISSTNCPPFVVDELCHIYTLLGQARPTGYLYRQTFPYDYRWDSVCDEGLLYQFKLGEKRDDLTAKALAHIDNANYAISSSALEYLIRNQCPVPSAQLVSNLRNPELPNDAVSHLVTLIRWSQLTPDDFASIHEYLVGFAWRQDPSVSLSLSLVFDLIHSQDPNSKSIAIPLLLSEIPKVRIMTSYHINNDLANEIDISNTLFAHLAPLEAQEIQTQVNLHCQHDYTDRSFSTFAYIESRLHP